MNRQLLDMANECRFQQWGNEKGNGPVPGGFWIHEGDAIKRKMTPQSHALVTLLWTNKHKSALIDEMLGTVFVDKAVKKIDREASHIATVAKVTNNFFKTHKLPWKVTTQSMPIPSATLRKSILDLARNDSGSTMDRH